MYRNLKVDFTKKKLHYYSVKMKVLLNSPQEGKAHIVCVEAQGVFWKVTMLKREKTAGRSRSA